MLQQTTAENKLKCKICLDKGFHVEVNSNGKLFTECCSYIKDKNNNINQFYCDSLNRKEYNLDDPVTREKIIRRFNDKSFKDWPNNLIYLVSEFINNWQKYKKEKRKSEILLDPIGKRIIKPPEEHQNTAIHLFTRNQIFQIVSDKRRKIFTKISKIDGNSEDISVDREFLGWGEKTKFIIRGPILCDYDQEIFDALTKIWHEKYESKWICIKTNLSEIWRYMGNQSRVSGSMIKSIKRSLERLASASISAKSLENKDFWVGGIIDDVAYKDEKGNKGVIISFNKYMMKHYLDGAYSTIVHPIYTKLRPITKRLYLFLNSHKEPERRMAIEKFIAPLGINENIELRELKRNLGSSIEELKRHKILDPLKSRINEKNEICSVILEDAWNAKPIRCDSLLISPVLVGTSV